MEKLPSQPILGLIDGMEVLQLLAGAEVQMSGADISRTLGIERTKVNRILKTLAYQGFAEVSVNKKYRLGPAIHVLSAQILHGSYLIKKALKYLVELTELNVVVAMGVLWKDKVAYTYHWEPGISPMDGLGRVDLFPATLSSIGLKLLAGKRDEQIQEIIDFKSDIPGFKSSDEFMDKINKIRAQGYSNTVYSGNKSIAVKIGVSSNVAIALAHIGNEMPMEDYIKILNEKAQLIEKCTNKVLSSKG
ncbi:helix-turn-helix domain-containing protein [Aestuariibaculum suncheonense]|uniref:Helix-turn-helix domain-containing protein n=1 Tax=Aestuariibaculum suncheonense TaxID=1028745 RepID=A0A8J6UEE9_9FLAO|nr:helix-turn-helix domain-containing protein [Aestuariibaculum suncheonense]MBD0833924.1 helix-turn-helix domain-containing protein [Aestuariibaculum suncheonense]